MVVQTVLGRRAGLIGSVQSLEVIRGAEATNATTCECNLPRPAWHCPPRPVTDGVLLVLSGIFLGYGVVAVGDRERRREAWRPRPIPGHRPWDRLGLFFLGGG